MKRMGCATKTRESTYKAIIDYNKKNMKRITLDLNKLKDGDVLKKMESVPNKRGYILSLIRKDIEKDN